MTDRRQFLYGATALMAAVASSSRAHALARRPTPGRGLVPAQKATAPNYWCTWSAQNYLYGQGASELDAALLEGSSGAIFAQKLLNERVLQEWAQRFYPAVREELYLVLDDGWAEGGTATFRLDPAKFPSFTGAPPERLRRLNDAVRAQGWRSLALWCRNTPGGAADEELISWSKTAGIPYWKVDGGDTSGSLARAREKLNATLTLEHMHSEHPLNGDWRRDGRFGPQAWDSARVQVMRRTDVYRTYDTTAILSVSTTLDRAAELLRATAGHEEVRALLNVEDEVYIAAVLGCAMVVMRHPLRGLRPGADADVFITGPRQLKRRMDEVVRAVRWQRIAAPFAAGIGSMTLDTDVLTDNWVFQRGQTFHAEAVGQRAMQGAPARIARSMELPEVRCEGESPFVFCGQFPNGAAAIGTHERHSAEKGMFYPKAQVRWHVGKAQGPFGIFGHFGSLTIALDRPVRRGRIWAQDLTGEAAIDITDQVKVQGTALLLPGELIDRVGRSHATPGDLSAPGLVVEI